VYYCHELIDEISDVFFRPKKHKYLHFQIDDFLELIREVALFRDITEHRNFRKCKDPRDNYLFDLADLSQADYLVAGDKTVLKTQSYPPTKVISYTQFREMFL